MATQVKLFRNLSLIVVAALVIILAPPLSVIGEEVITLTTIMPSQDILKVKKGVVGVNYKDPDYLQVGDIDDNDLYIEGNVGIGTTNPGAKLEVYGDGMIDPAIDLNNNQLGGGVIRFKEQGNMEAAIMGGSFGVANSILAFYAGANEIMRIREDGNVGIGTTAPNETLHVNGSNEAQLMLSGPLNAVGETAGLEFRYGGGSAGTRMARILGVPCDHEGGPPGGNLLFQTAFYGSSDYRTVMTLTGNVGIGTTSPDAVALLDVTSTTKGFLPPRMTTTQRDAISSPPAGLMVYNTATNELNFYNGSAWEAVTSS